MFNKEPTPCSTDDQFKPTRLTGSEESQPTNVGTMQDPEPSVSGDNVSARRSLREAMLAGEAYNKLPNDSEEKAAMRGRHLDRIKSFLRFEVEPLPEDKVDYILVAGTSPFIDAVRYRARVMRSVELAAEFPESKIIFTGKMPHESRRTGMEALSEADMMMIDAVSLGLDPDRAIQEPDSNHLKENVEFSIRKILDSIKQSPVPTGIVVVTSQSIVRRAYYGAQEVIDSEFPEIKDKLNLFFLSSDDDLNDEGLVFYEMRRLSEYRERGWL